MGNLVNLPNINPDAMLSDLNQNASKKTNNGFNAKNYLDTRLDEDAGETSKTLTIRLLPMDLETGNPFKKVHFHNVKVPKEVSKSGYKSYLCLSSKNPDIDHDKFGYKCPFCELNHSAYQDSLSETDPVKKKALQDLSIANISREVGIVRCIERGKESEGVKFWKFNIRADKTDPYNQIIKLYNQRKAEGEAAGQSINILDIYNGYDLIVTITSEGTAAPTITDAKFPSPLSRDEEQMKSWIYDEKKWQDVFTPKPYEYLSLISEKKIPWFDRNNNIWVDKEEYDGIREQKKAMQENDVRNAEAVLTGATVYNSTATVNQAAQAKKTQLPNSMIVDDSNLPW